MPASPSPPPSSISLDASSLPSLHASFSSEQAILEQLLYKNRNQHRKANYYQKLQAVARSNRSIHLTPAMLSSMHALYGTADSLRSSMVAILRAAEPLYALLRQTYFMPFALTSLAVLARLLAVSKAALLVVLVEAKEREEREAKTVRLFSARSVGTALLRALRDQRVEEAVTAAAGWQLDETWLGADDAVTREAPQPMAGMVDDHAAATHGLVVEKESEEDSSDDSDSAVWPAAARATAIATTVRQPPPTASDSAFASHPPSIRRTPVSRPTSTAPQVEPRPSVAFEPRGSLPPALATAAAATMTKSVAAGNQKRKAAASTEQATPRAEHNQRQCKDGTRQTVAVRRSAGMARAVQSATSSKARASAPADDIDAIFGF